MIIPPHQPVQDELPVVSQYDIWKRTPLIPAGYADGDLADRTFPVSQSVDRAGFDIIDTFQGQVLRGPPRATLIHKPASAWHPEKGEKLPVHVYTDFDASMDDENLTVKIGRRRRAGFVKEDADEFENINEIHR